jgi:hypothetical protein
VTWQSQEPPPETPPLLRRGKRHSQAMFVTGIVITSLAPIGLLVTSVGLLCGLTVTGPNSGCGDVIIGGLVTTAIFTGVGVPLIVVGAKRDPVAIGRIAPWVTPRAAGVSLRFDL